MAVRTFVHRVFGHWSSGMTGALSLPLTVAVVFVPGFPAKLGLAALAALSFGHAAYAVWAREFARANDAEGRLALRRPVVVPEVAERSTPSGTEALLLSNIGEIAAVGVAIDQIGASESNVTFDPIQLLRPTDGRVSVRMRFLGTGDLREMLVHLTLVATIREQRAGRGPVGDDFEIPLQIRYADADHRTYVDDTFAFAFTIGNTRAPIDSRLIVRKRGAIVFPTA